MPSDDAHPDRFAQLEAFLRVMFDREAVDEVDDYCAPSFRLHDADATASRAELKANLRESSAVFEKRVEAITGFGCRDHAAARFTRTYDLQAEYMGVDPSGQSATFTATVMCAFEGDRITEMWVNNDDLGVLASLGVVDPPDD